MNNNKPNRCFRCGHFVGGSFAVDEYGNKYCSSCNEEHNPMCKKDQQDRSKDKILKSFGIFPEVKEKKICKKVKQDQNFVQTKEYKDLVKDLCKTIAEYQEHQKDEKEQSIVKWKSVKARQMYNNDLVEGTAYLGDVKCNISIYKYDNNKKKCFVWVNCKYFEIEWKKSFSSFEIAKMFFEEVFEQANKVVEG